MRVEFKGFVKAGLGEGTYYVREYSEKIAKALGFVPFPGTLNIKLSEEIDLKPYITKELGGFEKAGKIFGSVSFIPVRILAKGDGLDCYLVLPEESHHPRDEIEFLSESNLREKFQLEDGDEVRILFK